MMTLQEELSAFFSQMREEIMSTPDEDNMTIEEYLAKLRDDIENDRIEPVVADAIAPNINECEEETSDASSKEEESSQHEKPKFLDKCTFELDDIFKKPENKDPFIEELRKCGSHADVASVVCNYYDEKSFYQNNAVLDCLKSMRFTNMIRPYLIYGDKDKGPSADALQRKISQSIKNNLK